MSRKINHKLLPLTLERISYIKELVQCIKPIKICAWEKAIKNKIEHVRVEELSCATKLIFVQIEGSQVIFIIPLAAIMLTFIVMS